ncbi:MAG: hypothetical protein PUP46_01890 [Endozoicomonas sp. (ex Botrylloides leachii)]|nr:hypothetical protein [Endozoicomonas sp. (ex Botrylloides leachii)]
MSLIFTVYCCGTGSNRYSNDIVSQLCRETSSQNMINDGPGGGGPDSNSGRIMTLAGLIGGRGVDNNVAKTIDEVKKKYTTGLITLNMCGWSRGAMTCFKIANALYRNSEMGRIKCNIFAIDPVPGATAFNNHMWKEINYTPNIGISAIIFAQHERRSLFEPYYPQITGPFTDVDIMPGTHSAIVKPKPKAKDAALIVKDMAKRFLTARGTVFKISDLLYDNDILEMYATISQQFNNYAKLTSLDKSILKKQLTAERAIRNKDREIVAKFSQKRTGFFINAHHREAFYKNFPCIVNEVEKSILIAFRQTSHNIWMTELGIMERRLPKTFKLTISYMLLCQHHH